MTNLESAFENALQQVSKDDVSNALFNILDVREALSKRIKNRPLDEDGSDTTIGDCLDDVVQFLETLESSFNS